MWDEIPDDWPPITSVVLESCAKDVPDPIESAGREAKRINSDRNSLYAGLDRILEDAPRADRKELLAGLTAYHSEAMSRVPSFTEYPESKSWVDYVIKRERELKRLAGLNDEEIALAMSLDPYLKFRGFRTAGLKRPDLRTEERCRTAFIPNTDQGPLHIKNVDDPITFWKPKKKLPETAPLKQAWWKNVPWTIDGVGSGLHIEDEPAEIFPLPVMMMVGRYAGDTPSIVEFLRKYSIFWGGRNLMVYDAFFRTSAIEKSSPHFFETFEPDAECGFSHISGMVCRDPGSPQGIYQKAMRDEYRKLYGLPEDGPDALFWGECDRLEIMLGEGLRRLGKNPKVEDVIRLFTTSYPGGLRKDGIRIHADQGLAGYTLITYATLFDKKLYFRWQRSSNGTWPDEPEICRYE